MLNSNYHVLTNNTYYIYIIYVATLIIKKLCTKFKFIRNNSIQPVSILSMYIVVNMHNKKY